MMTLKDNMSIAENGRGMNMSCGWYIVFATMRVSEGRSFGNICCRKFE